MGLADRILAGIPRELQMQAGISYSFEPMLWWGCATGSMLVSEGAYS